MLRLLIGSKRNLFAVGRPDRSSMGPSAEGEPGLQLAAKIVDPDRGGGSIRVGYCDLLVVGERSPNRKDPPCRHRTSQLLCRCGHTTSGFAVPGSRTGSIDQHSSFGNAQVRAPQTGIVLHDLRSGFLRRPSIAPGRRIERLRDQGVLAQKEQVSGHVDDAGKGSETEADFPCRRARPETLRYPDSAAHCGSRPDRESAFRLEGSQGQRCEV